MRGKSWWNSFKSWSREGCWGQERKLVNGTRWMTLRRQDSWRLCMKKKQQMPSGWSRRTRSWPDDLCIRIEEELEITLKPSMISTTTSNHLLWLTLWSWSTTQVQMTQRWTSSQNQHRFNETLGFLPQNWKRQNFAVLSTIYSVWAII